MKKKFTFTRILFWLILAFFYLPIVYMILFSFNSSKSLTGFTGFSLKWYGAMLESHDMMSSLYITIIVAVLATLISTIIGTISAIGLLYSKSWIKKYVSRANDLPMMNPEIVTAIGLMLLFITFTIPRGFVTLLLAHIAFCIPYVMLSVTPKLRQMDPNLADAAMDLGASPFYTLVHVIVPEIMPGIISGGLIAFTMSFDDFIISYFATGNGVKNLSIMVYTMSKRVNPSINAISTLVVALITIGVLAGNLFPIAARRFGWSKEQISKMGKTGAVALIAVFIGVLFFYNTSSQNSGAFKGQKLQVYMPGEYISPEALSNFEQQTGASVVIDNYDSNEQAYIKLANHDPYDIFITSDYMIQRCIEEELIQPLDPDKVDEALAQMDEAALGFDFDPENRFSVPYFFGDVGIVYNKNVVSLQDLESEGWNIFQDPKYKGEIYLYDSERDQMMTALKALGYSMNTANQAELDEAYNWLVEIVQNMKPEIVTDEIIDNMINGRKALGLVYSGDAAYILQENADMGYYRPLEGTNVWIDSMTIPMTARNLDLAYEFINYIAGYEAQTLNSLYVGYAATNGEVLSELSQGEFANNEAYLPRSGYDLDEVFVYDPHTRAIIAEDWSRVKVLASNAR